jgi:hypothetical protein
MRVCETKFRAATQYMMFAQILYQGKEPLAIGGDYVFLYFLVYIIVDISLL